MALEAHRVLMKKSAIPLICRLLPGAFRLSLDQSLDEVQCCTNPLHHLCWKGTGNQWATGVSFTFEGWKLLQRLFWDQNCQWPKKSISEACQTTIHKYLFAVQSPSIVWEEKIKFLCRVLFDVVPTNLAITLGDSLHSQPGLNKTQTWDINALSPELGRACCSPAVLQWILQIYHN